MTRVLPAAAAAAALAACATSGWERMRDEFPEVRANCRLSGTEIERDRSDPRLLHLVFRHRSNMAAQARDDGRLACAEHWARERGYRLVAAGANGPRN